MFLNFKSSSMHSFDGSHKFNDKMEAIDEILTLFNDEETKRNDNKRRRVMAFVASVAAVSVLIVNSIPLEPTRIGNFQKDRHMHCNMLDHGMMTCFKGNSDFVGQYLAIYYSKLLH